MYIAHCLTYCPPKKCGKIMNWLASERCPKSKLVKCFSWIDREVLDADSMDQQGVALLWLFQGPLICKQLTSFMNGRNLPREWLAVLMETKKLTEPNDPFEGIANVWSTISLHSTWRSSWTKYVLKEKIYVALNVCGNKCTSSISLTIFSPWAHFALKSTLPWGMFPLPCNVKLCMVMTFKCSSQAKGGSIRKTEESLLCHVSALCSAVGVVATVTWDEGSEWILDSSKHQPRGLRDYLSLTIGKSGHFCSCTKC